MARKFVTKSKPVTKIRKYQTAGLFSSNANSVYQQVANPYYVSGSYTQEARLEAQKALEEAARFGDYSQTQKIQTEIRRKEEEAAQQKAVNETNQQIAAQNQQEVQQTATDALSSGTDLAKTYFKQRAFEQAAANTIANSAMQAGTAGVWVPTAAAPTAASVGLNTMPTLATSATGTNFLTAAVPTGAVEVGSQVGQAAAAGTTAGTTAGAAAGVGAGAGTAAGGTAANTAASTGASAAGTGASIGAGLATAGVGLGLNIGGTLLEKSGDDNDFRTFTAKEKDRNLAGSAMKSAGTGVGVGAAIGSFVPGIGTVIGGAIGGLVGGGIGLIKGAKENKESKRIANEYKQEQERIERERAEYERKRKEAIRQQGRLIANSANRGFIGSRLQGLNTGFGYNTSTNMNTQPTSSFYGKTGGSLPGGHVVPIGDDAVKFIGRKHSEGGIKLDPRTEVEGGETMDKVLMNGGKPNDYFFSAYLKLGGKSFAKRHEELVKAGASQKEIQDLAKKQEAVANKKGEKDRGPEQIAKYGGIHKYKMAGPEASAMAQSNMDAKNVTLRDANKAASSAPSDQQSVAPGKRTNFSGMVTKYQTGFFKAPGQEEEEEELRTDPLTKNITSNNWAGHVKSKTPAPATGLMLIQSAVPGFDEREKAEAEAAKKAPAKSSAKKTSSKSSSKSPSGATTATGSTANKTSTSNTPVTGSTGFPEGRRAVTKDEYGESTSMKGVPKGQHAGNKFYGNVTDQQYADMVTANPWYDFTNFDPSNKNQVIAFQKAYNEKVRTGERLKEDGKFGEQTATARLHVADLKDIPMKGLDQPLKKAEVNATKDTGLPKSDKTTEEEPEVANLKRGVNGSLLAGLGQLIPVGYALARPYKTDGNLPRMQYAGNVGAGSVRGAILPRVNMNAERAAAERNTVAVKNAIQNTNAGPGGIAAMMAANTAQGNQMLAIANQEQEANKQLAAEEARMGQQASQFNVQTGLEAGKVNVANKLAVDQANLEAGIQEARLKIDEKRYKREEILGALDTAASRIAGIVKDERSYKAQERLAKAIDGTGSYDRFTIYEQLKKESKRKNSPYHGKTDAELRKIASNTYNEFAGKQGEEADETKKMGGRRYTSRLGDLNRGRNKRNFNI